MKIFFNSGLARSGSTLLQNILAQNPDMNPTPTSGVLELLLQCREFFTMAQEFKNQEWTETQANWNNAARGFIEGWYQKCGKKYIVDKGRGWTMYYRWLSQLYDKPKLIVTVRDLRGILSSMEKLYQKNGHLMAPGEKESDVVTIEQRVQRWLTTSPVGPSLAALYNSFHTGEAQQFCFVRYEDLMTQPEVELTRVYRYLEIPEFQHDLQNMSQLVHENDAVHGIYGDHNIRPTITPPKEDWDRLLGQSMASKIVQDFNWFYQIFYPQRLLK